MKNDIDSILDALFSGGKLNVGSGTKSRAAKDAEDFLNSIEKTNADMQSSLNRQISDLDKLTSDAQRSMDEMRRLLDAEGLTGRKKAEGKGRGGAAAGPRAVVPRGEGSDGQNGHWAGRIFGQPVHRISPPERDGARKRQVRGGRRDLR